MKKSKLLFLLFFISVSSFGQINTTRMLEIGQNALYFEDYVVSIQYFNQVIKAKPYLAEPYLYRAIAKVNLDDFVGSISDCNTALEINPFLAKAYYCRGFAKRKLGNIEESTQDFTKALEFEPNNIMVATNKIDNLVQMKKLKEALAETDTFINKYPNYSDAYLYRSQIFLKLQDTVKATDDINKILFIEKNNDLAYALRGMLSFEQKRTDEAITDLNKAIQINPYRADYYTNRAIVRMKINDLRGAMNDFDTSIQTDNQNATTYFNRGILKAQVGDNNNAIEDFSTSIALEPDNYTAYLQRATLRSEIGEYKAAISDFDKIINRYPDFIVAYYGRGDAKKKMRDKKGAEKDYYLAMTIEEDIKSGKRKPIQKGERKEAPTTEARAIIQELNKQRKNDKYANNTIRGQIQHNDIDIAPLGYFALETVNDSIANTHILFNRTLSTYNQQLKKPLCLSVQETKITSDELNGYFKLVESTSAKIKTDSTNIIQLFERAFSLVKIQDYSNALNDYTRILSVDKNNALTHFCKGNVLLKKFLSENKSGNEATTTDNKNLLFDGITSEYTTAYTLDNSLVYALYNIGYINMLEKNFKQAVDAYTQAIEKHPEFAEAYYNRGLIYLFQGNKEEGRTDLSKAGELGLYNAYNVIERYAY